MERAFELRRVLRFIPAILWMAWIYWLSSQEALPPPPGLSYTLAAIAGHFALYLVLTAMLLFAFGHPGNTSGRTTALAVLIAFVYAISDEVHQSQVPGRDASVFDVLVDSVGILVMAGVWTYLLRKTTTT